MKTKKISVDLPENLYNNLQEIAGASTWSFNEVLLQTIRNGMPPSLNKVPATFHAELLTLNKLDDKALFNVIEAEPEDHEQDEDHRRASFDALRRMYALSLLKWRGHPIPSPYESLPG
ncbi:MAG: hypothetical protein R3E31_14485 [Chloroflexota bacterium]|nr:hypothetical protein [Anaerolineales bacterium]MCB8967813.1 hypothetical protein [Ardenticatenaceae bacterium]